MSVSKYMSFQIKNTAPVPMLVSLNDPDGGSHTVGPLDPGAESVQVAPIGTTWSISFVTDSSPSGTVQSVVGGLRPGSEGSKDAKAADKPGSEGSKDAIAANKAVPEGSKGPVDGLRPGSEGSKGLKDADRPGSEGSKGLKDADRPGSEASKGLVDADRPGSEASKAVADAAS